MKTKLLTSINAVLAFLISLLGFTGCQSDGGGEVVCEYGVPHSDFTLQGQVVNEDNEPLPSIQIVERPGWKDGYGKPCWSNQADTFYTDSTGSFQRNYDSFDLELHQVIANDTAGIYASDTITESVTYSGGDGNWNMGQATLQVNFTLKKK